MCCSLLNNLTASLTTSQPGRVTAGQPNISLQNLGARVRNAADVNLLDVSILSAVGSNPKSRIRYARIMGLKEETVAAIGFQRLAMFQPGIIGGNVHTPGYVAWLGRLIPGPWGTIEQDDIGRALAAEFNSSAARGVEYLDNAAMKQRSRELAKS